MEIEWSKGTIEIVGLTKGEEAKVVAAIKAKKWATLPACKIRIVAAPGTKTPAEHQKADHDREAADKAARKAAQKAAP